MLLHSRPKPFPLLLFRFCQTKNRNIKNKRNQQSPHQSKSCLLISCPQQPHSPLSENQHNNISKQLTHRSMGSSATEEQQQQSLLLGKTLKEGERILAPTRRPDGTLRKPIRIRAGYVPQEEVAIYQSKGALLRKASSPEVPPGYDPVLDGKPRTKAAKRNEKRKEKKQQAALASLASDKGKNLDPEAAGEATTGDVVFADDVGQRSEAVESVADQINKLAVSATSDSTESSKPGGPDLDLDKKIRALKKKIRLAEPLEKVEQHDLKPEQLDKLAKLEGWREELKLLEDKKAAPIS